MSADTNSIFYQIGQATKTSVNNAISALIAGNNTWTGTNDFQNNVSVGTSSVAKNLKVWGTSEVTSDFTVGGNLTVNGTTTTLSSNNLDIKDNFIRLSEGASQGAFTKDQGFYFERAQGSTAAAFIWDESEDEFVLGQVDASVHKYYRFQFGANQVEIRFDSSYSDYSRLGSMVEFYEAGVSQAGSTASEWSVPSSSGYSYLWFTRDGETTLNDLIASSNNQSGVTASLVTGDGNAAFSAGTLSLNAKGTGTTSAEDATAEINAGAVKVGSLKIAAQALGDLADFNAGLSA